MRYGANCDICCLLPEIANKTFQGTRSAIALQKRGVYTSICPWASSDGRRGGNEGKIQKKHNSGPVHMSVLKSLVTMKYHKFL